MNKFTLLLLISWFCFFVPTFSQAWMKDLDSKKSTAEIDFITIQKAFNEYWEGKEIEKGKGWKQFRRWEHFMEPRVYPDGKASLPSLSDEINILNSRASLPANWTSLGPDRVPPRAYANRQSGAGRINCIAFHPTDPNIMWAGAPSGGFWKTTNGGLLWTTINNNLMSIGVSDIVVNPSNPNHLFIVTGDGDAGDTYSIGILESTNGGIDWLPTSLTKELSEREYFRRLIIHPTNSQIMLASSNKGIYKTSNGFASFKKVAEGHFKDLEINPGTPTIVYATSYSPQGNAAFYKSINTGDSFTEIRTGMPILGKVNRIELTVSPAKPNYIYAITSSAENDGFFALFRSRNSGGTWTKVYDIEDGNLLGWDIQGDDEGGQGWYDLSLAVSQTDEATVLAGGINVWKSTNEGEDFNISAHWIGFNDIDYVHADHHMLVYSPLNNKLYSCNDGGIYVSSDHGDNWTDISEGLEILQIYRISASTGILDLFLAGNQDNGTMKRSAGEWAEVTGGDGMECIVHPDDPNILYTSYYYGTFLKSVNNGESYVLISPEIVEGSGAWVTPFIMDPNDPEILYSAYNDVFKSRDGGLSWHRMSEKLSPGVDLQFMAVAPSDENYIYTATYNNIWITRTSGATWENIKPGLPDLAITSFTISPFNPEKIWLSLSGYEAGEKVYYSDNGGKNWINYSNGLPNIPANIILSVNESKEALYLGTDVSVFYRNSEMNEWMPFKLGMPNVVVNDLEIQYNYNRIIAGTFGRGLWISDLQDNPGEMFAEIYSEYPQTCVNTAAEFHINTINQPDIIVWNMNNEDILSAGSTISHNFDTPGMKNISVTVYKNGQSYTAELNNYFKVVLTPEINISIHDISNLHVTDEVYLHASGANSYSWEPAELVNDPDSPATIVTLSETTEFIVTGSIGNCVGSDKVLLTVHPGPDNDNVCNAFEITAGLNGPYTNVYASIEKNEPMPDTSDCNTQMSWCNEGGLHNTVWFKYTATGSPVSIRAKGFDNQIALYEADGCEDILNDSYTIIAANDDYYSGLDKYAAAIDLESLENGKTYWLQVDGSAGGETGGFYLDVNKYPLDDKAEELSAENFSIYPNPNQGEFTISLEGIYGKVNLEVYEVSGRLILKDILNSTGNFQKQMNISEKGIYIIKVYNKENSYFQRLIVE